MMVCLIMNKKQSVVTILALMLLLIVSDILYLYISKRHTANQAVRVYNEFIEGRRCNGGESILSYATPTREPEKRYATDYFMADSTGDGIPELHLRTSREYVIFTYRDKKMEWLHAFFSNPWEYHLLRNGEMIHQVDIGDVEIVGGTHYDIFTLDRSGGCVSRLSFGWTDINNNNSLDNDDEYYYGEGDCTMDEWLEQTKEYIYRNEEGHECILNEVDWIRYCEAR